MRNLLWFGDSPSAATGFGTVSRNVLDAFLKTGEWSITVAGKNYWGTVHGHPYAIHPVVALDPKEPNGGRAFLLMLSQAKWDLVIVNDDLYLTTLFADEARRILDDRPGTKLINYFPVDSPIHPSALRMFDAADLNVAYSLYGQAHAKAVRPHLDFPIIPHGCEQIERITPEQRREWRHNIFGASDETFVWMTCNRNSTRKDIPRAIEAFNVFQDYQPNTKFYINAQPVDNGIDLHSTVGFLNLNDKVIFPTHFNLSSGGLNREDLMRVYQLADGFITTHLGEGWGLTLSEAMAAGLPCVAPNNTTMPEILGADYPYLYPCKETAYIDNCGFRPKGTVRDIFAAMKRLYEGQGTDAHFDALVRSESFVLANSWKNVGQMWLALANHVMTTPSRKLPLSEAV